MRFCINNLFRSVKGHPKENAVILLNMVLCTLTVFILIQNYYFLKEHFDVVYGEDQIAQHYIINMSDEDFQAMLSDILNKSPMYYVGQKVNSEIADNPHLELYYLSKAELELSRFKDRERMRPFSYFNEDLFNFGKSMGKELECDFVSTMIVTDNADKVFNLKMSEGRFFDVGDRNTNDPDIAVPVILGNDYAGSFKVGDIIEMTGDKAIVIGILDDNMYMSAWGSVEYLDNQIMTLTYFPRDFNTDIDSYDYRKMEIFDSIYCDDTAIDVQKEINRITAENGYYTYEVQPTDGVEISETKDVSAKNVALIGLLALIVCIVCMCSLSSVLYNRTVQDRAVFCIYMCCGIPLWKINLSLIIEMVIFLGVSFFPTYALSIKEYGELLVPAWQILVFSGIIVLVSMLPVFKINRENNLDMLIRDKII